MPLESKVTWIDVDGLQLLGQGLSSMIVVFVYDAIHEESNVEPIMQKFGIVPETVKMHWELDGSLIMIWSPGFIGFEISNVNVKFVVA